MTQNHASTGRTYKDKHETPVPFPAYRCKATAAESERLGRTHLCKLAADHDEQSHVCICGKTWEPVLA